MDFTDLLNVDLQEFLRGSTKICEPIDVDHIRSGWGMSLGECESIPFYNLGPTLE